MNNIFFTADLHLGHNNIRKHCKRPWSTIEEMDEGIITRWNTIVNSRDLVYVVGDFAMPKKITDVPSMKLYNRYISRLKGKKIIVLGNHDKMSQDVYSNFTEVYPGLKDIKIEHQKITLCHYPMRSWNSSFHGAWHFFGHVHGRTPDHVTSLSTDVGVDVKDWNYTPIPWDVLKKKMLEMQTKWSEYWASHSKAWKV